MKDFATVVFENWGEYIDYFLPFNEINAGYFSPYNGVGLVKKRIDLIIRHLYSSHYIINLLLVLRQLRLRKNFLLRVNQAVWWHVSVIIHLHLLRR